MTTLKRPRFDRQYTRLMRLATAFMGKPENERRAHIERERRIAHEQSDSLRGQLIRMYGYRCMKCGATGLLRLDHILPVSRGGKSSIDNLQFLCEACDTAKSNWIEDYRPR